MGTMVRVLFLLGRQLWVATLTPAIVADTRMQLRHQSCCSRTPAKFVMTDIMLQQPT